MPTLQAFEGDTLEAALARVSEEVGRRARIMQAEKVRSGGLAGFFARERYEVTVEIDDDEPAADGAPDLDPGRPLADTWTAAPAAARPAEPLSLLDLVDQVSQQERGSAPVDPAPDLADTERSSDPIDPIDPIAAARECGLTPPSTESRTFQDVLRGLASDVGLFAEAAAPADADDAAGVLDAGTDDDDRIRPFCPPVVDRDDVDVVGLPRGTTDAEPPSVRADAVTLDAVEPAIETVVEPEAVGADDTAALLGSLGVPAHLHARATTGSPAVRILSALEAVAEPEPLEARRGDVVVIVGDAGLAAETAASVGRRLGLAADDVVVAAPDVAGFNTLATPDDAAAAAALWRRCGAPFVVALSAPDGPAGVSWVQEMRDALAPVAVWGAVRADRKPEDIARWAGVVGGLDALAVSGCDQTASPAAVLSTAIPVAMVEGRRATPAAWTALLVERLAP